jgi:hypothetical protein
MTMAAALIVPIQVQALLVNARVRAQSFQRWSMDYASLAAYVSPEPPAFSGDDPDWAADSLDDGVHLHWTLPTALRHGVQDSATGTTAYPKVPNRWLVVRAAGPSGVATGRTATAWIVESDYVGADGTSPYVDPTASTPTPTLIGRALPLAGWSETGAGPLFLTAVGPGNVAFASYQPYVANVFSLHDPVTGVTEGEVLSYLVVGWYSDPSADVLAGTGGFAGLTAALGWDVTGAETAATSVYHGMVRDLTWSSTATAPRPTATRLAVGNTSVDALTALIRLQAAQQAQTTLDPDLLEAFQYDLLRALDDPDGPALLDAQIHDAWFGSRSGGSVWEVVAIPPADSTQAARQEDVPVTPPSWLAGLNHAQAAYDQAVRELSALRRQLYETWWKRGNAARLPAYPEGLTDAQFAAALNPAQPGGIAAQVVAQAAAVAAAQAAIPWGATQADLAQAIMAYTAARPLSPGTQLKRSDLPPFRVATDPVVVVAGTQANAFVDDLGTDANGLLPCRFADQVVTGLVVTGPPLAVGPGPVLLPGSPPIPPPPPPTATVTAATLAGRAPTVDLTNVPAVPGALLTEFLLLDPANAALVVLVGLNSTDPGTIAQTTAQMTAGSGVAGTLPAILQPIWTQPWAPLFFEWEVLYYPIAYTQPPAQPGAAPVSPWSFDGTGYTWTGAGADTADPIVLSGRTILTPQPAFTFKARLDAYLASNPDVTLSDLESFIASIDGWDFLSQTLSGFNALLTRRDPTSGLAPDAATVIIPPSATLATLVGPDATARPLPGAAQPEFGTWPSSGFQPLRAGQFAFRRAAVVDRFGQSLDLVTPDTSAATAPVPADGLTPQGSYVLPGQTARFVQLPPRLLQAARLAAGFVSATDDTVSLPVDGDANPVCAWILPNHLDAALSCYDPGGAALGEVTLTIATSGQPQVTWLPAPGSGYGSIASLVPALPHLAEFLQGVQAADPGAFTDLLTTIDATLWSIDPPGTGDETYLSALVGRPLALVRAALRCELAEPALTDPAWPFTFAPQPAELLTYSLPVRLGAANLSSDGLVGYLAGSDAAHFHAVLAPAGLTTSYVSAIGPGNLLALSFADADPTYLTLLMDPQAPVHAFTDILPVTTLTVPQRFVASALGALAVTVRGGPLLTDFLTPSDTAVPEVVLPRPTELNGTWSWVETDGTVTTTYGITPADQAARFASTAPTLRTGWLQLSGALGPSSVPEVRRAPPGGPAPDHPSPDISPNVGRTRPGRTEA